MADMLKGGLAWLTGRLAASASQVVTYARGYDSAEVRATFGAKLLRLDDGDGGTRVEWTDLDFCIPSADLAFDGEAITPERGDLIYVALGDATETFEVLPFGASEPAWRWSDPHGSMVRVHAKHVGTEAYS